MLATVIDDFHQRISDIYCLLPCDRRELLVLGQTGIKLSCVPHAGTLSTLIAMAHADSCARLGPVTRRNEASGMAREGHYDTSPSCGRGRYSPLTSANRRTACFNSHFKFTAYSGEEVIEKKARRGSATRIFLSEKLPSAAIY